MTAIEEVNATSLPVELSSLTAKLVYLYLLTTEVATVDQLRTVLGVRKITLFPVLRRLEHANLVKSVGGGYVVTR